MSASVPDSQLHTLSLGFSPFSTYSAEPGEIEGVGFWARVGARVIDFLVHAAVSFVAGLLFAILLVIAAAGHPNPVYVFKLKQITLAGSVLSLLGSIGYQAICEGLHGSSLGKLALSMVVVQEDGSCCSIGSAMIRSFAYLVDSLFFGLIGYLAMQKSFQKQRNGDAWAHTVVCKRAKVSPENLRAGGRFVAVLLCAAAADAALVMVSLLLKVFA